jgi:uncharacterized repeat protein (TIGR02543 family)
MARVGLLAIAVLLIGGAVPAFSSTQAPLTRSRLFDISALPKNPVAYERAKATANARYAKWAQRHGVTATHYTAVSGTLNQPGLDSSDPFNGSTPPDTTGAIGPSNYVEMVNSEIGVWSSSNLSSAPTTLDQASFVGDPAGSTCDGQIQWDQEGQRWIYAALYCPTDPFAPLGQERLYFGFSKGTSPLPLDSSNWCQYQIATETEIEDYPKLGHDDTQIIIGANGFDDSSFMYTGSSIFVLPKPAAGTITSCPSDAIETTASPVKLSVPNAFTPVPANIADSSANGYVVGIENTANASSTKLEEYTITPGIASGTMSPTTVVAVPSYSAPASVPEPATSDVLDSLDGRLTQAVAVKVNGAGPEEIWTQHTVDGGGPSVVRWYELTPGSATPTQSGTVQGPNNTFAFMGAISPSSDGQNAAIFYNSGSSSQVADLRVQDRRSGTASGTMIEDAQLGASSYSDIDFSCNYFFAGDPCRWGDYNGASPDPSSTCLVWGTGELTTIAPDAADSQSSAQWGSQNAAVDTCTSSYTLTASTAGNGSGTVSSNPNGIGCAPWCANAFGSGTSVGLTATPATGSTFSGWSGDCTTAPCNVTMDSDHAVTATFTLVPETLTVSRSGAGTGTVASTIAGIDCGATCAHDFNYGTSVTLTATPGANTVFTGWSGACSGIGNCTVSMKGATSVTATFGLAPKTLTVSKAGAGTGTVASTVSGISCGATCSHAFDYGASVTLTVSAGAGSMFTGWSGACTGTGACTVSMNASMAVTATFGLIPETLTVAKSGTGSGKIASTVAGISCGATCSHAFDYGTSVTLTASPVSNARFAGWSGACSGTGDCTVSMTAAASVTAKFTKIVCVVPNVKGKKLAAAKSAIANANCSTGTVKKKTSTTVKKGKVISQSPAKGKHLADGAKVNLVVSKGK